MTQCHNLLTVNHPPDFPLIVLVTVVDVEAGHRAQGDVAALAHVCGCAAVGVLALLVRDRATLAVGGGFALLVGRRVVHQLMMMEIVVEALKVRGVHDHFPFLFGRLIPSPNSATSSDTRTSINTITVTIALISTNTDVACL